MHATTIAPIGLIWFSSDNQPYFIVKPESDRVEMCATLKDCPKGYYLTNLDFKALHELIERMPEWTEHLMHQKGLFVNVVNVAEELGLPESLPQDITTEIDGILVTVKHSFNQACFRLGLDLGETGVRPRAMQRRIFSRTASPAMQQTSIEDAGVSFSPQPHRWVKVPTSYSDDNEMIRISLDRKRLYGALLTTAVPVGEWLEGDDKASMEIVISAMSEQHDVLVDAELDIPISPPTGFPSTYHTDYSRTLFTGQEIRQLVKEGIGFKVRRWWHGRIAPAPKVLSSQSISMADGLMLEMVHRSWRENPEIGFWLAITERVSLHGFARRLFDTGVEIRGFGTGKIMVRCQKDAAAKDSLITRLLKQNKGYGLQFPLNSLRQHPELYELLPLMTDQQSIAMASPTWLRKIDAALRVGDKQALKDCMRQVDQSLSVLVQGHVVQS